jgi:hypothetical protein
MNWGAFGTELQSAFTSGLASGLSGGLAGLVAGIPFAGPILAPLVQQITSQIFNQLLGVGGGAMGAGAVSVPAIDYALTAAVSFSVVPTLGKIEDNTKALVQIDQQILSLHTQICMFEKTMRRIAIAMEDLTYVHNPNASKAAIMALSEMKTGFVKYFQIGALQTHQQTGVPSPTEGTNGGPLMVQNQGDEKAAAQKEAGSVVVEQVQQTAKINDAREISRELQKQNAETALSPFYGTLSPAKLNQLKNSPETLSDDEYWQIALASGEPGNNKNLTMVGLMAYNRSRQNEAALEAELSYLANQGYKSKEDCPSGETVDGACRKRVTKVPGSSIKVLRELLTFFPVLRAIFADEIGEDAVNALMPQLQQEMSDFTRPPAQETATQQQDPCPGPGPCPKTGWQSQVNSGGFEQALTSSRTSTGGNNIFGKSFTDGLSRTLENGIKKLVDQGINLGANSISNLSNFVNSRAPLVFTGQEQKSDFAIQAIIRTLLEEVINNDQDIKTEQKEPAINILLEELAKFISEFISALR